MELICKITDEDIGEEIVQMQNPFHRKASRGIVLDSDGNMAVFYKKNKNQYKLPGGGLDEGETFEEAFIREVEEDEGGERLWMTPEETLEKMRQNYNSLLASEYTNLYSTKIVAKRDMAILQKYIEIYNKLAK